MQLASVALAVVVAAGCGKKKEGDGDPAPTPAAAIDAGLRPPAPQKPRDMLDRAPFVIQLSFTEAEQSRDAHSTTVHATIIGDRLFYKESSRGAHAARRGSLELNDLALTPDELAALRQSIQDKGLLKATSVKTTDKAAGLTRSVRADLKVRVDDARNQVSISGILRTGGADTALAATDSYRGLARFAGELRALAEKKAPPPPR